jgi:hypothetical protein
MARVQRMRWLSLAALLTAGALLLQYTAVAEMILVATMALLIGGAALTIVMRLRAIVRELEWT